MAHQQLDAVQIELVRTKVETEVFRLRAKTAENNLDVSERQVQEVENKSRTSTAQAAAEAALETRQKSVKD